MSAEASGSSVSTVGFLLAVVGQVGIAFAFEVNRMWHLYHYVPLVAQLSWFEARKERPESVGHPRVISSNAIPPIHLGIPALALASMVGFGLIA